jgi:hypothetical protein
MHLVCPLPTVVASSHLGDDPAVVGAVAADPVVGAAADPVVGAAADPVVGAAADPVVVAAADPVVGAAADPPAAAVDEPAAAVAFAFVATGIVAIGVAVAVG